MVLRRKKKEKRDYQQKREEKETVEKEVTATSGVSFSRK